MTRITIEVDGSQVQSQKDTSSPATQQAGAAVGGTGGGASAELFAQAATLGAINAGPAPSMDGASGAAPIAASIPEAGIGLSHPTISAGAAPEHLFEH